MEEDFIGSQGPQRTVGPIIIIIIIIKFLGKAIEMARFC
jgi:hypothetical protein